MDRAQSALASSCSIESPLAKEMTSIKSRRKSCDLKKKPAIPTPLIIPSINHLSKKCVEELASLIKDNLSSKHIILSVEEMLIDFLKNDARRDGILELEPMGSYHRLLLHRLSDIYGFSHESFGEGDSRHLVLERCPESSIPSVLVSDILGQYNQDVYPIPSNQLFRRKEVLPDFGIETTISPTITLEEREAAYMAARVRIFSMNEEEAKTVENSVPKPRNVPVVARRMIAHALGRKIISASENQLPTTSDRGEDSVQNEKNRDERIVETDVMDVTVLSRKQSNTHKIKAGGQPEIKNVVGEGANVEKKIANELLSRGKACPTGSKLGERSDYHKVEQLGAAKRMFAHALGLPKSSKGLLAKNTDASRQMGLKS